MGIIISHTMFNLPLFSTHSDLLSPSEFAVSPLYNPGDWVTGDEFLFQPGPSDVFPPSFGFDEIEGDIEGKRLTPGLYMTPHAPFDSTDCVSRPHLLQPEPQSTFGGMPLPATPMPVVRRSVPHERPEYAAVEPDAGPTRPILPVISEQEAEAPRDVWYESFYTLLCDDVMKTEGAIGPIPLAVPSVTSLRQSQCFTGIRMNTGPVFEVKDARCSLYRRSQSLGVTFTITNTIGCTDLSWYAPFSRLLPPPDNPSLFLPPIDPEMSSLHIEIRRDQLLEMYLVEHLVTDVRFGKEMVVFVLKTMPTGLDRLMLDRRSSSSSSSSLASGRAGRRRMGSAEDADAAPFILRLFFMKTPREVETLLGVFVHVIDGPKVRAFRVQYPKVTQ
jgi:hypothetical protein